MLYVTECSIIPPVDNATPRVGGFPPDLPIERGTQVDFVCNSGYSSKTKLMAVCTSGEVNVSNLKCYRGNDLCTYKHQCIYQGSCVSG